MNYLGTNGAFRASRVKTEKLNTQLWCNIKLTERPELLLIRLCQAVNDERTLVKCLLDLYENGWHHLDRATKNEMKCWFENKEKKIFVFDATKQNEGS